MNNELIRASERAHYIMQLSSYFTELTDSIWVKFAYTRRLSDTWYNQAYDLHCEIENFEDTMNFIVGYFSKRERVPSIYLTPASSPNNVRSLLEKKGYAQFDQEAWMFCAIEKPLQSGGDSVKITNVQTDDDLMVFANIYRRSLPGPEVERYIESVVEGIRSSPPLVSIRYFTAYIKGEPAGMASLLNYGSFAGVYAVATVPEHRHEGCSKALTSRLIETARSAGAKHIFLQTGAGDESEEIFKGLGFRTEFVREGYAPESAVQSMTHR